MRARYKGPAGTGIVEIPDEATVEALFDELRARTGIRNFTVKYGPPMAMRTIESSQRKAVARSLGLHGETLTIVPDEARPVTPPVTSTVHPPKSQPATSPSEGPEEVNVPWLEREGTLRELSS